MAGYLFNTHAGAMFFGNAVSLLIVSAILYAAIPKATHGKAAFPEGQGAREQIETGSLVDILRKRPLLIAFAGTNLLLQLKLSRNFLSYGTASIWAVGEIISATNTQVFIAAHTPSSHRGRVNGFIS
jgi:hypothetical protein